MFPNLSSSVDIVHLDFDDLHLPQVQAPRVESSDVPATWITRGLPSSPSFAARSSHQQGSRGGLLCGGEFVTSANPDATTGLNCVIRDSWRHHLGRLHLDHRDFAMDSLSPITRSVRRASERPARSLPNDPNGLVGANWSTTEP
jgi:hypothetical protein